MSTISLVFGGFRDMDLPPCARSDQPGTAAEAYAAYNRGGDPAAVGLNHLKLPCPEWDALPPNVRAKWQGATDFLLWGALRHFLTEAVPPELRPTLEPTDYMRAGERMQAAGVAVCQLHPYEHPLLGLARAYRMLEPGQQFSAHWFRPVAA